MNSQGFAAYLTNLITEKLQSWKNSLLAGIHATPESEQFAKGVIASLSSVAEGIPAIHNEFTQIQSQANNNMFSLPGLVSTVVTDIAGAIDPALVVAPVVGDAVDTGDAS